MSDQTQITKRIIRINASSLREASCMLRWKRTIIDGYYQETKGAALVYGVAVHKYIDTMFKTEGDMRAARDAALEAFRVPKHIPQRSDHLADELHLLPVCFDVWDDLVMKDQTFEIVQMPDGRPATEVTFSIKFYEDDYCVVYLEGTIDKIGKIKGGCYAIGDYKTTSQYNKDEYLERYFMSAQLRFYVLSLKLMAEQHPESMLGKIGATKVGAFIDGIFLKPKAVDTEYRRSKVFQFSDETLAEFRATLVELCKQLSASLQSDHFPRTGITTGACEGKWGLCQYYVPCTTSGPLVDVIMKRDFKQKPYDPLKHNEL